MRDYWTEPIPNEVIVSYLDGSLQKLYWVIVCYFARLLQYYWQNPDKTELFVRKAPQQNKPQHVSCTSQITACLHVRGRVWKLGELWGVAVYVSNIQLKN